MEALKLFYFNKNLNFGDMLNISIINNIFNIKNIEYSDVSRADVIAIGSLLEYCLWRRYKIKNLLSGNHLFSKKPLFVYGTGFLKAQSERKIDRMVEHFYRPLKFKAVRGLYTKKRIENIHRTCYPDLVLGDPGLLASLLIDKNSIKKKYAVGILPHFYDIDNPKVQEIAENTKHSKVISSIGNPLDILKNIAECETIVSTSLHGLVVSDSLGIPNKWAKLVPLWGDDYKFEDYYSVYGVNPECLDLYTSKISQQEIIDDYKINYSDVSKIQQDLIKAFSFIPVLK